MLLARFYASGEVMLWVGGRREGETRDRQSPDWHLLKAPEAPFFYGASPLGRMPIGIHSANNAHVCDDPSRRSRGHYARRVLEQSRFRWPAGRQPGRPGRPRSPGKSCGNGGVVFYVNLFRLRRVRRLAVPGAPSLRYLFYRDDAFLRAGGVSGLDVSAGLDAVRPASSSIWRTIWSTVFLRFSVKSILIQKGALPKASTRVE